MPLFRYLKLLKRKRRKPVPAASYFLLRLRWRRCDQRCQSWLVPGRKRSGKVFAGWMRPDRPRLAKWFSFSRLETVSNWFLKYVTLRFYFFVQLLYSVVLLLVTTTSALRQQLVDCEMVRVGSTVSLQEMTMIHASLVFTVSLGDTMSTSV